MIALNLSDSEPQEIQSRHFCPAHKIPIIFVHLERCAPGKIMFWKRGPLLTDHNLSMALFPVGGSAAEKMRPLCAAAAAQETPMRVSYGRRKWVSG
jgi:hypothetical protein